MRPQPSRISVSAYVLLVLALAANVAAQEFIELRYGESAQYEIPPSQLSLRFRLVLSQDLVEQVRLNGTFMNLLTDVIDPHSIPLVYISGTTELPPFNRFTCAYKGFDLCFLPPHLVVPDAPIYITISRYNTLGTDCKFTVKPYRTKALSSRSTLGETISFQLDASEDVGALDARVFRVFVPDTPTLYHLSAVAQVTPATRTQSHTNVRLVTHVAEAPPSSGQSFWGLYRNEFGMTFTAFRGDPNFVPGATYFFMVIASAGTEIEVQTRADSRDPQKIEFEPGSLNSRLTFYDAMPIGRQLSYFISEDQFLHKGQTINGSLVISLLTNQGNPDLYVSCNTIEQDLRQSQWQSTSYGLETLLISHEELQKRSCQTLYITVYAAVCAGYRLQVHQKVDSDKETVFPIGNN